MKKIAVLLLAVFSIFSLSACAKTIQVGEFPELKENNFVEMNAQEMVQLLSTLDYTEVDSESVRMSVKGTFSLDANDSYESQEYDYETNSSIDVTYTDITQLDLTVDAMVYAQVAQQVADVKLFSEGTFDIDFYSQSTGYGGRNDEASVDLAGTAGAYFSDQYLYVKADVAGTAYGEEIDVEFKEKYNEQVTQVMWDDVYGQADAFQEPEDFSDYIPYDLVDLFENGDIETIMEEIPNLKVYKDGTSYSIQFTMNKQDIISNYMDVVIAIATEMGEEIPSQNELDEMEQEFLDQINPFINQLELEFVITIEEGRIVQIAMSVVFVGNEDEDVYLNIDMTVIIDFGVTSPKFPNDLDEYQEVLTIGAELN